MNTRNVHKIDTNCFSAGHQRSWHNA